MTRAAAANRVGSTFSRCSLRRSPLVSCSLITPLATCLTLLIGLLLPAGLVPRDARSISRRSSVEGPRLHSPPPTRSIYTRRAYNKRSACARTAHEHAKDSAQQSCSLTTPACAVQKISLRAGPWPASSPAGRVRFYYSRGRAPRASRFFHISVVFIDIVRCSLTIH